MAQTLEVAIYYARCLAKRVGGHPLHSAKPIDPYPNFLVDGTDLFDVAWINDTGRLSYGFSAALGPNAPRNMVGDRSLLPPFHERYTGGDLDSSRQRDIIDPGGCYQSWMQEKTYVAADASVALAATPAGTVSVGGEVSFTMTEDASALLYLPKPHTIVMSRLLKLSSNYAKKHTAQWYRFLNGDNQHNAIRNGDLYFVTSCFKTAEWHNACTFSCHKATGAKLTFHPTSQIGTGFSGQFDRGSGAIVVNEGPGTQELRDTQCVVVVGWKLALCSRFIRKAKVPVSVNKAAESTFTSKFIGRSQWTPYSSKQTTLYNDDLPPSDSFPSKLSRKPLAQYHSRDNGRLRRSCSRDPDSKNEKVVAESGDMACFDAEIRRNSVTESLYSQLTVRDADYTKLEDDTSPNGTGDTELVLPNGCHGRSKIIADSEDAFWVDTGKQLGIDGYGPAAHALTEVFPYIEESAPWMETVIAHDLDYLSVVAEDEVVPEAKELAARLMVKFVIDIDEDMNGMLVNREDAHLTQDDLAFVVHDARRYTDISLGFDVVRKNIPVGWTLTGARFGLGAQTSVAAANTQCTTVTMEGATTKDLQSTAKTFEMTFGIDDGEDDEDENDFPSDASFSPHPPPPYHEASARHSPYTLAKAGLASLEYLDALNSDKGIVLPPADLASAWEDCSKSQAEASFNLPKKFFTRLAKVVSAEQKRHIGLSLAKVNEACEVSMLMWAKLGLDVIEKTGHPQALRYVAHRKRVLEWYGYRLWCESASPNSMRSPTRSPLRV